MTSANKSLNMAKAYSFLKCRLENLFDFHCNLLIYCLVRWKKAENYFLFSRGRYYLLDVFKHVIEKSELENAFFKLL